MTGEMTHEQLTALLDGIGDTIYRDAIAGVVPGRVERMLRWRNVEMLARGTKPSSNPLGLLIKQAERAGDITFDEGDILLDLDFLVSSDTASGDQVYAVVEASCPVTVRDVLHSKRAAALLRRLTGCRVEPFVIGNDISEEAAEQACWDNVRFVRVEKDW